MATCRTTITSRGGKTAPTHLIMHFRVCRYPKDGKSAGNAFAGGTRGYKRPFITSAIRPWLIVKYVAIGTYGMPLLRASLIIAARSAFTPFVGRLILSFTYDYQAA